MADLEELVAAFGAPSRQVGARVVIDFTGQFENRSAVFSSEQKSAVSRMDELKDGSGGMSCKYALLDGWWTLGSGFALAHDTWGHIGFISAVCSGPDGRFALPVTITVSFETAQTLSCITVIGDDMRGEYPVDFTLRFYGGQTLIKSRSVTGNSQIRALLGELDVAGCTRVQLDMTRWSRANTPAKIAGVAFSPIAVFDENIIRLKTVESDGAGGGLITGSVASRSLEMAAADNSGRMSVLSNGALSRYILPNRRVRLYWGAKTGGVMTYTPAGVFYTDGWEIDETGPVVRLSAMDILSLLDDIPFEDHMTYPCPLSELAESVFAQANMNITLSMHPFLSGVSLIYPPEWGSVSLRRVLSYIAEAAFFRVKTLPDGSVFMGPIDDYAESGVSITPDNAFFMRITEDRRGIVNHVRIYAADGQLYEQSDRESISENGSFPLTIRGNPVIEDYNWAAWLGERIIARCRGGGKTADAVFRGDPRVGAGCRVSLCGRSGAAHTLAVISQTVDYDGSIKAAVKGRLMD